MNHLILAYGFLETWDIVNDTNHSNDLPINSLELYYYVDDWLCREYATEAYYLTENENYES